jgi:hypothetical protein
MPTDDSGVFSRCNEPELARCRDRRKHHAQQSGAASSVSGARHAILRYPFRRRRPCPWSSSVLLGARFRMPRSLEYARRAQRSARPPSTASSSFVMRVYFEKRATDDRLEGLHQRSRPSPRRHSRHRTWFAQLPGELLGGAGPIGIIGVPCRMASSSDTSTPQYFAGFGYVLGRANQAARTTGKPSASRKWPPASRARFWASRTATEG